MVGTSIGAVVGGCYAASQLDGLESWARGLKIRSIFSYLDISLSGSFPADSKKNRARAGMPDLDFIGEVEVLMLPGADRSLRDNNEADVLLCGTFAVVLALNGAWRIDQAPSLLR